MATRTVVQDVERSRALVWRYGWNATAYQVVNPGIAHWFDPQGDAVVGYVVAGLPWRRVRVVAGAPICPEDRLPDVIAAFEGEARKQGQGVCYFGAAGRVMNLLGDCPDYSVVVLGAQPTWEPAHWAETIESHASLRAQLSRARNKGVTVSEWPTERAQGSPELRRCLNDWLGTRPLPPLHFLVEPETLSRLEGRRVFVAERNGVPVGFVNCSPVPVRHGWLTEQFVRGKDAPNGTTELMLDAAVRTLAADGAQYVTMGLVPLSKNTWVPEDYNPLWLRFALSWVRAHGRRFYNFDGLDRFKAKFLPHAWEPIYAISNERRFAFATLYAIADAFSHGSPVRAVLSGIGKAARQELHWLRERNHKTLKKPSSVGRPPANART
jgi:phosphatidylglycerol lysyltransferase